MKLKSRQKECAVLVAVLLLANIACCEVRKTTRYKSPDQSLVAVVITTAAASEAIVEIRDRTGKLLAKESYISEDGQHGYYVEKAQWTPDSQFFVYSLESSGGHSVMVIPTLFFSVHGKKIFDLGDLMKNNIIFPNFSIIAPDKVKVTVQAPERTVVLSLSQLLGKKNKLRASSGR